MRNDPLIFTCCAVKRPKAKPYRTTGTTSQDNAPPSEATEQKIDFLICDLWQNGTDSVQNMRVVNTDAKSHSAKPLEKCLQEAERAKKRMYLEECLQKSRKFSPFVASVDVLQGVEATATLKSISSRSATKWQQPYSWTYRYAKSRIYITLVRATHRCIQGSSLTAHNSRVHIPQWEDGAVPKLFRQARRETSILSNFSTLNKT